MKRMSMCLLAFVALSGAPRAAAAPAQGSGTAPRSNIECPPRVPTPEARDACYGGPVGVRSGVEAAIAARQEARRPLADPTEIAQAILGSWRFQRRMYDALFIGRDASGTLTFGQNGRYQYVVTLQGRTVHQLGTYQVLSPRPGELPVLSLSPSRTEGEIDILAVIDGAGLMGSTEKRFELTMTRMADRDGAGLYPAGCGRCKLTNISR